MYIRKSSNLMELHTSATSSSQVTVITQKKLKGQIIRLIWHSYDLRND